jgi:hypothetical protein
MTCVINSWRPLSFRANKPVLVLDRVPQHVIELGQGVEAGAKFRTFKDSSEIGMKLRPRCLNEYSVPLIPTTQAPRSSPLSTPTKPPTAAAQPPHPDTPKARLSQFSDSFVEGDKPANLLNDGIGSVRFALVAQDGIKFAENESKSELRTIGGQ